MLFQTKRRLLSFKIKEASFRLTMCSSAADGSFRVARLCCYLLVFRRWISACGRQHADGGSSSVLFTTPNCFFFSRFHLHSPRHSLLFLLHQHHHSFLTAADSSLSLALLFFCFSPSELSLRRQLLAPPFQSISHRLSVTISVSSPTSLPTPSPLRLPFSFRSSPCHGFASVTLPEAALSWQLSG